MIDRAKVGKPREVARIVQHPDTPVERDVLATAIVKMSRAVQELRKSGLNERAIVVLVQADTGLAQRDVKLVLASLDNLSRRYSK